MRRTSGEEERLRKAVEAFYRSAKICGVSVEEAKRILDEEVLRAGSCLTTTSFQAVERASRRVRSMESK